jgi:two-component system NtrC family sensor kinase
MRSLLPTRLAFRLIVLLTIILVIAGSVSGWFSIKKEEELLQTSMILGADQLSRALTSATWHAMLADQRGAAYEIMRTIALKQGIDRIRIFNKEGRVMFSTTQDSGNQVDKNAEACYLCHASDRPLVKVDVPSRTRIFVGTDGTRKLAMVTPIYNEQSCSEANCHAHPQSISILGVLDVSLDLAQIDHEMTSVQQRVIFTTLGLIVSIGLCIGIFARRFIDKPIHNLIEGTRAVSAMRLDTPIEVSSTDELNELGQSFDAMRLRLRDALAEITEFTQQLEMKVKERTDQLNLANQELVQSDRLASLGQLAASVAHEINNPIAGVLTLSTLLQRIITDDGIPPHRIEEVKRYLSQVVNETGRVGRIVTDLLAFSRRSKPQRTNTNLNTIIRSTLSILDHKLKLMNVILDLRLAETLTPISCDAPQIQQVLINLIMNGAESMQSKGGGVLTLITRWNDEQQRVVLEVVDTGDGIPAEHLGKIFDPFFTTKEEGKGVGLGLAVVYGIIEAHKGDIEVTSTPGKGTMFIVSIPVGEQGIPSDTVTKGQNV